MRTLTAAEEDARRARLAEALALAASGTTRELAREWADRTPVIVGSRRATNAARRGRRQAKRQTAMY